jgi:hypothetical protein
MLLQIQIKPHYDDNDNDCNCGKLLSLWRQMDACNDVDT